MFIILELYYISFHYCVGGISSDSESVGSTGTVGSAGDFVLQTNGKKS